MSLELLSSNWVNRNIYSLSFVVSLEWLIEGMKDYLTDLDCIYNIEFSFDTLDCDNSVIMLLSS